MIHRFAQYWALLGRRRVSALLLAVSLNLAILPCAMAFEDIEPAHDCCPSEIQLEASDCCALDDVSVDSRGGAAKLSDSPDFVALPAVSRPQALDPAFARHLTVVDPPDPPGNTPPLHKLFCVYLR
ncbi:MAG: hypothetical protein OER91_00225 [Gammaproteobacteria bacterium]|nr:hypothetical protein [Gammaproteobacteria bacterium]